MKITFVRIYAALMVTLARFAEWLVHAVAAGCGPCSLVSQLTCAVARLMHVHKLRVDYADVDGDERWMPHVKLLLDWCCDIDGNIGFSCLRECIHGRHVELVIGGRKHVLDLEAATLDGDDASMVVTFQ